MARKRPAEDLSVEELRHLLMEKRRAERQARLAHFRRTGRAVTVQPENASGSPGSLDSLRSGAIAEEQPTVRSPRRVWLDRLLFLVEIGAVIGLVLVLLNGMSALQNLNHDVAAALVQPTLTPTPLISAVVLPSGHTPPDPSGRSVENQAEIPAHLRPLVQSLADLPIPTQGPEQALRVRIPAIQVDAPVVQGDGFEQLKRGVGQHLGGPNPGQPGNLVLSGHNDVYGRVFMQLDKLQEGDQIFLSTSQHTYTYTVHKSQVVKPTQVDVMDQTVEPVVTLISCYPYMVDNKRIVISAYLEEQS